MRSLILAVAAVCLIPTVHAQQPTVLHARVTTQSAGQGLAAQIEHTTQPTWLGYQIAAPANYHSGSNGSPITYLEGDNKWTEGNQPYREASYDHFNLLMRVANGKIDRLRLENPDRQLDAAGLPFIWLTNVSATDSIKVLEATAQSNAPSKLRYDAVFFISLHQSPDATPALARLAGPSNDLGLRDKAAFWLANQRGHDGFLAIQHLAREDADPAFREKLTFDLTLTHDPAAPDELIHMAHTDTAPQVRRQAQFWMAQLGGRKVAAELRDVSEHDPNEDVRQSAVFALSRLPGDEAATQLIQLAQTSQDRKVRKQAIFWLGQSHDPRALDYLTKLIQQ